MQNWEYKKLEETCEFLDSKRKPITANKRVPGPYPYYGATGILDYVENYLFDEELILLGEDGAKWDAGDSSAFLISGKTWVNNHAHVLRPNENTDSNWIIYFLNYSNLMKYVKGATVPKLNQENARSIEIPLPPLEEQKRIVKILDEKFTMLETVKANAKANLQNAKDLFQSQLTKLISTSNEYKVADLFDIKTGKLNSNEAVPNGKYPFFTCSREVFAIDSYAFDCDAILLAGNNASGDFNVKHYCGKFNAYQRTYVLTVKNNEKTEIRLLYYVLENYLKKLKTMSVGANTRFLKLGMIQNLDYPNCSLPEQKRIVEQLDSLSQKVRSLEEIYTKQLANCDELKQAFLAKAFAGEM